MRVPTLLFSILLVCTLARPFCGTLFSAPLFEYSAEFLRIDSNRLYAWTDAPIMVNSDFVIEVIRKGEVVARSRVGGVLGRVIMSEPLSEDDRNGLADGDDCHLRIFLESDLITDSLIIAVPDNLRQLWLDTLWVTSTELPVHYRYRYFEDFREIEIAARLKQIDLLIMPEFELPVEQILSDSPFRLELTLISRDLRDDLCSSALNYCLRGVLAKDGDFDYSILIRPEQLANVFPRNLDYAQELFRQTKKSNARLDCSFPGVRMYPVLSEQLNLAVRSCGPDRLSFREKGPQPLALEFFVYELNEDSVVAYTRALREIVDSIRGKLPAGNSQLDSCLLGTSGGDDCREIISRVLAESARVIPLGRSRLAVKRFEHVRCLANNSVTARLADFYTVKQ